MCQANALCYTWTEYVFDQFPTEINYIADNPFVRENLSRLNCQLRVKRDFHALGSQIRVLVAAPDAKILAECDRILEQIVPEYCARKPYRVADPSKVCGNYKLPNKSDFVRDQSVETAISTNYWIGSYGERKKAIHFTFAKPAAKRLRWALTHNTRKPIGTTHGPDRLVSKWDGRRVTIYPRNSHWPSNQTPTPRNGELKKYDTDSKVHSELGTIGRSLAHIKATHKSPFPIKPVTQRLSSKDESMATLADVTDVYLHEELPPWTRLREVTTKPAMGDGTNSNMNVFQENTRTNLSDFHSLSFPCWSSDRTKENTLKESPRMNSGVGDLCDSPDRHESSAKQGGNTIRNTSKDLTGFTSEECYSNPSSWDFDKDKGIFASSSGIIRSHCSSSEKSLGNSVQMKQYLSQFIGDRTSFKPQMTRRTHSSQGLSERGSRKSDNGQIMRRRSHSGSQKSPPKQIPRNNLSCPNHSITCGHKLDEIIVQQKNPSSFCKPPRRFIRMNEMKRGNLIGYSTGKTLAGACASHDVATQFVVTRMSNAQMDAICQTHDGVVLPSYHPDTVEPRCQEVQSLCQLSPVSRSDNPMNHIHPVTVEVRPHVCQVYSPDPMNVEIGAIPVTISSRTVPAYGARSCGVQVDWPGSTESSVLTVCHRCHRIQRRDWFTQPCPGPFPKRSQVTNNVGYLDSERIETAENFPAQQRLRPEVLKTDGLYGRVQYEAIPICVNQTQRINIHESLQVSAERTEAVNSTKKEISERSHLANQSDARVKSNPSDRTMQTTSLDGTGFIDLKSGSRFRSSDLARVFVVASGENKGLENDGTAIILTGNSLEMEQNHSETEPIRTPVIVNRQSSSEKLAEADQVILDGECTSHSQPSSWSVDSSRLRICTVGRRVNFCRPVCTSTALHRADRVYITNGLVMDVPKSATKLFRPKPNSRLTGSLHCRAMSAPSEIRKRLDSSRLIPNPSVVNRGDRCMLTNARGTWVTVPVSTNKLCVTNLAQMQMTIDSSKRPRREMDMSTRNHVHELNPRPKSTCFTARLECLPRLRIGCRAPQCMGRSTVPSDPPRPVAVRNKTIANRKTAANSARRSASVTSLGESEPTHISRQSLSRSDEVPTFRSFSNPHPGLSMVDDVVHSNMTSTLIPLNCNSKDTRKRLFSRLHSSQPNSYRKPRTESDRGQIISKTLTSNHQKNFTRENVRSERARMLSKNYTEIRNLVDSYLDRAHKQTAMGILTKNKTERQMNLSYKRTRSPGSTDQVRIKSASLPGTPIQGNRQKEWTMKRTYSKMEQNQPFHEVVAKSKPPLLRFHSNQFAINKRSTTSSSSAKLMKPIPFLHVPSPLEDHSVGSNTGLSSDRDLGDRCTTEDAISSEMDAFDERLGVALQGTLDRILWESADQLLSKREPLLKEQIRQTYFQLSPFSEITIDEEFGNEIEELKNDDTKNNYTRPLYDKPDSVNKIWKSKHSRLAEPNARSEWISLWCCAPWRCAQRSYSQ